MDALSLAASVVPTSPEVKPVEVKPVEVAKEAATAAVVAVAVATDEAVSTADKINAAVRLGANVAEKYTPPNIAALIELAAMSEPYMVSLVSALLHLHKKAHTQK